MASILITANSRTATHNDSIWREVSEKAFRNQIINLWKHTKGRPGDPFTYAAPVCENKNNHLFTFATEVTLAEGFAFVAATKKGVESVSAAAIAVPKHEEDGLLVYVASNDDIRPSTKEQLQIILSSLRRVASRGKMKALLASLTRY